MHILIYNKALTFFVKLRNNISFLPAKQQTTQKLFFRQLVDSTHTHVKPCIVNTLAEQ